MALHPSLHESKAREWKTREDSARMEITGVKNVEADWICYAVKVVSGVTSVATSIFTYITVLAPLDKLSHCST